jgi:hypothetical protein
MSSRTKAVSMDRLALTPDRGSVLLRLMMVVNDFVIANDTLNMWKQQSEEENKTKRQEAFKYLVESQIGHIYEGMLIIKEIEENPSLIRLVEQCDTPTRDEFKRLADYRKSHEYEKIMGRVRNNLAFHYDAKLVQRQLIALVNKHPGTVCSQSMGSRSEDWLFEAGAMVNERVAVREVFEVPDDMDATEGANLALEKLQSISTWFMQFAGHFVWKYTPSAI